MLVRQSAWPSSIPSTGRFPYEGTGVPLWPEARGVKVVSFGPREYCYVHWVSQGGPAVTTSPIDPNRVLLTGENPYIRLSETVGGPTTTDASFWRILFCPGGPGNVLFLQS